MRKALSAFLVGLAVLEVASLSSQAQIAPHVLKAVPPSLKTVPVPTPVGIEAFIKDNAAAVALGKALFWDMQTGGDGLVACATCHHQAGADHRTLHQLNPGANAQFDLAGPNHALSAAEYPFHMLANPDDRGSLKLRSRDDVTGSQGVHAAEFVDVQLGSLRDQMQTTALDPLGFSVGGLNVRRVTGRNSPSVINSVYNMRNFWDGRANRRFNGRNPFGDSDPNARVLQVNDLGELEPVHLSIDRASLASQAVGPPVSDVEMSATGRTWMKLGKKLLTLTPLGLQEVRRDDSVLGPYAVNGAKGLNTTYADLIRAAFHAKWWDSPQLVDASLQVLSGESAPRDGSALPTNKYTLMEANFSLFWGLAIQAYEATLVSDDAPYDRYREGDLNALTPQQQFGLLVFMGKAGGNCIACHFGAEFTGATFNTRLTPEGPGGAPIGVFERMIVGDGNQAVYDGGFYNIAVRPTTDDIGLGANDPFGRPLSLARQEQLAPGSVQDNLLVSPILPGERITADGAFKTPSLRNVELTGPYFHNGSEASLRDVVQFYARGGNFRDENLADLDFEILRLMGLIGHPNRQIALTNFLRSLTDERVRWAKAPFDHPELLLPEGAQGTELSVLQDLRFGNQGADVVDRLPATGRQGATAPAQSFLSVPVFDGKPLPAPNPTYSDITLFATDTIAVATSADVAGDVWSGGSVSVSSRLKHTLAGDITAGRDVIVTGDTTVFQGSIMARGSVRLSPTSLFKDGVAGSFVEHYAPMAQQAMPPLPVLPLIRSSVTVPMYGIQTLTPGRYGSVTIQTGGWLVLTNGTYVFKNLKLASGAFLQYDPDGQIDMPTGKLGEMTIHPLERTIVHVTEELSLGRSSIIAQGDPLMTTHFKMYYRARGSLEIPRDAFFHGTLVAPNARVLLAPRAALQGAAYARAIYVADKATFNPHLLPIFALPPGAGGLGALVAGPPAPDDGATASGIVVGLPFALGQNSPNPFRPSTVIRFTLPESRPVALDVFDVAGRRIRSLVQGPLGPGTHTVVWDGTSDHGERVASGVFFYRLTAGADRAQRKMVRID